MYILILYTFDLLCLYWFIVFSWQFFPWFYGIGLSFILFVYRSDTVYLDDDIRVVKDIRGDYLVVERAPYSWKEWRSILALHFSLLLDLDN